MKIVVFSAHCLLEQRKAGFHHITDALLRQGHEVLFYTAPVSELLRLNQLRKGNIDHRLAALKTHTANQIHRITPTLTTLIHHTKTHPISTFRPIEALLDLAYAKERLHVDTIDFMQQANLAIFESCYAIHFYEALLELNPKIRLIYRVSDDLNLLRASKRLLALEQTFTKTAHLISCPSAYLAKRFPLPQTALQLHGISKQPFLQEHANPYTQPINAVFVGISHVDTTFLEQTYAAFPHVHFHIIGPIGQTVTADHVTYYGEMPFEQTIPFIQHADIGLQILSYSIGAESLSDSLKVLQYTFCGLPIVAPEFVRTKRVNTFYYQINQADSMVQAMQQALDFDRTTYRQNLQDSIHDWDALVGQMLTLIQP